MLNNILNRIASSLFFRLIIWIPLIVVVYACTERKHADLILHNGTIYTMDPQNPVVEAVVVNADTIVFAGALKEAEEWKNDHTKLVDLEGATMTPGFIEGHAHIMGIGMAEMKLNLQDAASFDEIIERVRVAASKAEPGEWILGEGWHQDKWTVKPEAMIKGFPIHTKLSAASPNNPVFLRHASGHAAFANAKAMEIAGVNPLAKESFNGNISEGGEVIVDDNGNPTGLFNERAQTIIAEHIPSDSANAAKALELAMFACARNGITSFHDAGASRESIALFKKFQLEKKLSTRLYVMLTGFDRKLVHEYLRNGPDIDEKGTLTIRSIKLNCDGALGSRGAWLLDPYSDRPDTHGMATLPMDTVLRTAQLALSAGFQVCSHAIGDRANKEILDRYEVAFKENPSIKDHRFRIEHAQHLHPDDINRFAALGVIPAMQAIHMSSDRPWAIDRLGEKRIREGAYMWQALLKSGARIVNGTDAPVEPLNPIPSFYASVTRKTLKGTPDGGYEGEQKMTREQALRSYTLDAAYGAFEEDIKGSIEPGKLADFTIFSNDIMKVDEDELLSTVVLKTIVGGKIIFEKQ